MANLTRTFWPLGWTPDADAVNGNPQGLLRMDNLQMDEDGVLGIVQGLKKLNIDLPNYADRIYSKIFGGKELIWIGCGASSQEIVRFDESAASVTNLGSGTDHTVFGDCLGNVLIMAGIFREKDNGIKQNNLGLLTPDVPVISEISQAILPITGTWALIEGHGSTIIGSTGITTDIDLVTLESQSEVVGIFGTNGHGDYEDTLHIGDGPALNPDDDVFQFEFIPDDASVVTGVRLDCVLDGKDWVVGGDKEIKNYYSYVWTGDNLIPGNAAGTGTGPTTILQAKRSQFIRTGQDGNLDWSTVLFFIWTVQTTAVISHTIQNFKVIGGVAGNLNGYYNWVQVNVSDNGFYIAKSPASNPTSNQLVLNGNATLQPAAPESQVTDIYYYRISVNNGNLANPPESFLDQYYLIGKGKPGQPIVDNTSDIDAIEQGDTLNAFLTSLNYQDTNGLKETIISVEGLYNERMLYLTASNLYLSDRLNPDAIDSRYTIRVSGDPTESNLWIRKLTNNVLILGTDKNLYELSGTLLDLPDGTVDVNIIPIGEKYPPLTVYSANVPSPGSSSVASAYQSEIAGIAYVAADGIRMTAGSNSILLSPQLRLWFAGESRSEVPPPIINAAALYSMAAGKNRLYIVLPLQDGSYRLLTYDLLQKIWKIRYTDPTTIFATQRDRILLGYNSSIKNFLEGFLYELEVGEGVQDTDGSLLEGLPLTFQTVYDDNEQPRNRKDTFTLKLIADTGDSPCSVYIDKDHSGRDGGENWEFVGTLLTNGMVTSYYDLSEYTLGFRYAIKIVDHAYVTKFKLYEMTVEYEPRPEQLNYLRIQPDNLGTISRKRFISYAFVIDTLGHTLTFTPLIDNNSTGIQFSPIVVSTLVKQTVIVYFTSEQIGTDISGILSGGVFEFYGVLSSEIVSEKLPVPAEFLVIPNSDYGSPNRKRHTSYKFQINTRSQNVLFTPILDNISYTPLMVNTRVKTTVEYFFDSTLDVIGIDIGGTLKSQTTTPFEYYGTITPQQIEVLPPRLESLRVPNTNFGTASKKRIRTLPVIIDTYGHNVTFRPIIDGQDQPSSTLGCSGKTTLYHFFTEDVFGTDYGAFISSESGPFEFYELGEPLDMEQLPVPRRYDQTGPYRFDKIGKIMGMRVRVINMFESMTYTLIGNEDETVPTYSNILLTGEFPTVFGVDNIYEIQFPKSVNTSILRIVLGPQPNIFYRYDIQVKMFSSGMETDAQWVTL